MVGFCRGYYNISRGRCATEVSRAARFSHPYAEKRQFMPQNRQHIGRPVFISCNIFMLTNIVQQIERLPTLESVLCAVAFSVLTLPFLSYPILSYPVASFGCQMVVKWLSVGCQMVVRWSADGWQMVGRWSADGWQMERRGRFSVAPGPVLCVTPPLPDSSDQAQYA